MNIFVWNKVILRQNQKGTTFTLINPNIASNLLLLYICPIASNGKGHTRDSTTLVDMKRQFVLFRHVTAMVEILYCTVATVKLKESRGSPRSKVFIQINIMTWRKICSKHNWKYKRRKAVNSYADWREAAWILTRKEGLLLCLRIEVFALMDFTQ